MKGGAVGEELLEAIRSRRSIRRFTERPVSDDDVRRVVEAGTWAPSGANLQMWRFKVVRSRETLSGMLGALDERIEAVRSRVTSKSALRMYNGYVAHFGHFAAAPVVIAVQARRYDSIFTRIAAKYAPDLPGIDEADLVNVGAMSVSAAIENMLLAAHALGLGSCWLTGPLVAQEALEKMLGVETPWRLVSLVTLGYAAHSPEAPERKPLEEVLSFDGE